MTYDPFKLESGLLGNVDVVVRDAEFLNDPAYDNGQTLQLSLTFDVAGDDGGEKVENFSCGKGWETNDGGKTASREDGRETNFNKNSKVGRFFGSLVDVMGDDPACDKAIHEQVGKFPLGPREAGFWKGLAVHIDREEVDYGGEIGKRDVLVIDGFSGAAKKAAPAKAATKKAPAKTKAAEGGVTDEIRGKLDEIADASGSHDEFMESALAQVPEASSDDAVKAAVADDGAGSIWQDAIDRYNALQAG